MMQSQTKWLNFMLSYPLPLNSDPEASRVPDGLPPITDAHVHLFPQQIFKAIWRWFEHWAWPVRYEMTSELIIEFLQSKGISKIIGLDYAHKPGIARDLNAFMLNLMEKFPIVQGTATIFPGESHTEQILMEAFDDGLIGVKLHAHVQYFDMAGRGARNIYEICERRGQPLVMHVGRAPKNPEYPYKQDPYKLCYSHGVERILKDHPGLRFCVPHLGADEFTEYKRLVESYENLWLDTTMVLADYMPVGDKVELTEFRADRVMFGTDFPQIPFAWNHELDCLLKLGLEPEHLDQILRKTAADFYRVVI